MASIRIFLDSGLQRHFIALRKPTDNFNDPRGNRDVVVPEDLRDTLDEIESWEQGDPSPLPEATQQKLDYIFQKNPNYQFETDKKHPWIRYRFGERKWRLSNGIECRLNGIWLLVETNTADGAGAGGPAQVFDRGIFYQRNGLSAADKAGALELRASGRSPRRGEAPFIDKTDGTEHVLDFSRIVPQGIDFAAIGLQPGLDFGSVEFKLIITHPAGAPSDVDLILDLGNTRTAALLFEHDGNNQFLPINFRMRFKPLRLKPDPQSGESDAVNDVKAGIADSWFVLHELDCQRYRSRNDSHEPDLIMREWDVKVTEETTGHWPLRTTKPVVKGEIVERIPQMFMNVSPVLVGDAAYRQFFMPYARNMVRVGAAIQQSSPKRFYWDDSEMRNDWSMLLNDWDGHYKESPLNAAALPALQGDMCRFLDGKTGRVVGNPEKLDPSKRPDAYPMEPRYPRQSTLTWFLLHILERAAMQENRTFAGLNFIQRKFKKVLVTYPSGWTDTEIDRYRKQCEDALAIFSALNVRGGTDGEARLELAPRKDSPDEAVAGQLPFIFSETIRYPGQGVGDWIATMGRRRGNSETVRVMNFDIGGGTTDISVIEYRDLGQAGAGLNFLSTQLLFKDGQALAGDDLLKRIIEKVVFRSMVQGNLGSELATRIQTLFLNAAMNAAEQAVRSRIVRTCLIPLATYCLSNTEDGAGADVPKAFSAQDAGVERANWDEFMEFLNARGGRFSIPFNGSRWFSFVGRDIADLIDETFSKLFRSCALYAAAYEVDMVVFSGKTSEQPHIRRMARKFLPLESERIFFAKSFRPGQWYPFTNEAGFISDAKTVTVVGAGLYYALSSGFIRNWAVKSEPPSTGNVRNEWGVYAAMRDRNIVLLKADKDEFEANLLPRTLLARRRNALSSAEPVFEIAWKGEGDVPSMPFKFHFERVASEDGMDERLEIVSAEDADGTDVTKMFELKLHPCADGQSDAFWQESGVFGNFGE